MASLLIKKYGNRRLYDTVDSRYVTLDELGAKIRAGAEVRVVDAKTGEDLTQATLAQLILEGGSSRLLPAALLNQLIRLGDDALGEFFSRYVTSALDLYLQARRGVQAVPGLGPLAQLPLAATDALGRMWMGSPFAQPFAQFAGGFGGPGPGSGPAYGSAASGPGPGPSGSHDPAPGGPNSRTDDDVAAIRREFEEFKRWRAAAAPDLGRPGAKRKPRAK